ncbi:MAG: hypothetical protein ACJ71S_01680 [Acidobacteriaceae bacterium]
MATDTVTTMCIRPILLILALLILHICFAQDTPASSAQSGGTAVIPGPPELQKVLLQIVQKQLLFESNSVSTGATISLRELSRQHLGDRTFVKYELVGSGVAPQAPYSILRLGLDNSLQPVFKKASVLQDGTLVCPATIAALCGLNKPGEPLTLNFFGTAGEALRLVLTTPEGKPLATLSAMPFPLQSRNKGCVLSAVLLMPEGAAILIEGKGFTPNATVHLLGDSSGEKHDLSHEADSNGDLRFVVLPSTIGRTSGNITIGPTDGPCHPKVTVPWGKHSYQLQ